MTKNNNSNNNIVNLKIIFFSSLNLLLLRFRSIFIVTELIRFNFIQEVNEDSFTFQFWPDFVRRLFNIGHQVFQFLLNLC